MSSPSKIKGTRVENLIVSLHNEAGVDAERVPLSGSLGGKYSGDLVIGGIDSPIFRGEVKARKTGNGFSTLEGWLEGNDILYLKRDRRQPFVAMTWDVYEELIKVYVKSIRPSGDSDDG